MSKMKKILRKFGLMLFAKRVYRTFNLTHTIKVAETEIIIPQVYGIRCKVEEPWMLDVLKVLFKWRSGTFIDVGINIGQTLIQVKALDPDRDYIGFEPNPSCVFYLELLMTANNFKNCTIFPVGLYKQDTIKLLDLFGDDLTNSGGSLVENFRELRKNNTVYRKLIVPVYTFKNATRDLNVEKIEIIKIDVEGGELEVMESIEECISIYKPIIIIEVLPAYSNDDLQRIERQKKLENCIEKYSYKIFRILKDKTNNLHKISLVTEFGIHGDITLCDYLLIHETRVSEVENRFEIL